MEGRQLQSLLSCLPEWFRNYAALHMDTFPKLINHVLVGMAGCNLVLFMDSWGVAKLPHMGLNTRMISFLLCCQNSCLWIVFNNARFRGFPFLAPTEFMVGVSLGIAIGALILALVVSHYFRKTLYSCAYDPLTVLESICQNPDVVAKMRSVAFWAGLVFWLEFCLTLLIAMGRHDLVDRRQYHDLSTEDHPDDGRRFATQPQSQSSTASSVIGTFAAVLPTPPFIGNYTSVPEVHAVSPNRNEEFTPSSAATPLGNV